MFIGIANSITNTNNAVSDGGSEFTLCLHLRVSIDRVNFNQVPPGIMFTVIRNGVAEYYYSSYDGTININTFIGDYFTFIYDGEYFQPMSYDFEIREIIPHYYFYLLPIINDQATLILTIFDPYNNPLPNAVSNITGTITYTIGENTYELAYELSDISNSEGEITFNTCSLYTNIFCITTCNGYDSVISEIFMETNPYGLEIYLAPTQ